MELVPSLTPTPLPVTEDPRVSEILEGISDGFIAVDRRCRVTYVNREGERILGVPRDQLIGRSLPTSALDMRLTDALTRTLADGTGAHFERFDSRLARWFEFHIQVSPG